MKLAIGSDHAGLACKEQLVQALTAQGHEVKDYGCYSADSVDYADYALPVAEAVAAGEMDRGILICHTGIGMSMAANKVAGIRCALCAETVSARLTREHNDSNVLALGAGMIGMALAREIVSVWLATGFEGGRHQRRIDKVAQIEARR